MKMASLEMIEDRENVTPLSMDFDPIEGVFKAAVTASDVVPTAAGTGKILKLTHTIVDGEHTGRKIFTNYNIVNPSVKAQTIARGQLSSLAQACGLPPGIPADSADLHNREHFIKVKIVASQGLNAAGDPYPPKSEIKSYSPINVAEATSVGATTLAEDDLPDFMK
jgi:hypothetical protein